MMVAVTKAVSQAMDNKQFAETTQKQAGEVVDGRCEGGSR